MHFAGWMTKARTQVQADNIEYLLVFYGISFYPKSPHVILGFTYVVLFTLSDIDSYSFKFRSQFRPSSNNTLKLSWRNTIKTVNIFLIIGQDGRNCGWNIYQELIFKYKIEFWKTNCEFSLYVRIHNEVYKHKFQTEY